jgi:NCS1 family nucleobase:cation symporter-1
MVSDYYLLRKRKIRLSHLYRTHDSSYYFRKGFNWRAIIAWLCGWAPTIGGLVVTVRGDVDPPRVLVQLYFMAFLIGEYQKVAETVYRRLTDTVGFFISGGVFYILNLLSPIPDMDQFDAVDLYGTLTEAEARRVGVAPLEENSIFGISPEKQGDNVVIVEGGKRA